MDSLEKRYKRVKRDQTMRGHRCDYRTAMEAEIQSQRAVSQQDAEPVAGEEYRRYHDAVHHAISDAVAQGDEEHAEDLRSLLHHLGSTLGNSRVQPRKVSRKEAALIENYLIDTYGDTRAGAEEGVREILDGLGLQIEDDS